MKVLFHSMQLCERGTEVAMYDYAHYNETILNNESYISYPAQRRSHASAIKKFNDRFPNRVLAYNDQSEIDKTIINNKIDVFYVQKAGRNDGIVSKQCKTVVHVVFRHKEPHGDVYAYISKWLAKSASGGRCPYVPYMVDLPNVNGDLRQELDIPSNAIVFGRHGGNTTFDIAAAHRGVEHVAKGRSDICFVFLNTDKFCQELPNIIHLDATANMERKVKFINTCDATLHARSGGETFGLSVAEFSIKNKPVIACTKGRYKAHIEMLGSKGIYFTTKDQLIDILNKFKPNPSKNWDAYSEDYNPRVVMKKFQDVFLK